MAEDNNSAPSRKALLIDASGDIRPIPDPTALTNQLVTQAIAGVSATFDAKLAALSERMDALDRFNTKHTDLAVTQSRELVQAKIAALVEADEHSTIQRELLSRQITNDIHQVSVLFEQKIFSLTETLAVLKTTVNERFTQGDVQTEKAARDVKSAVDAAFAAAKEAVGEQNKSNALSIAKSEVATTKQIDQLSENLRISAQNTNDKIDTISKNFDGKYTDIKDRIVAMEASGTGRKAGTSDFMGVIGWVVAVVVGLIAALQFVMHAAVVVGAH